MSGEATENNPLWAIYQHSADQLLPKRYEDKLDIKKIRYMHSSVETLR
jgi:hypothetical protein